MKKIMFSCIFFLLAAACAFCQTYTVSGYIIDITSRETIIGAVVQTADRSHAAVSNLYGFFQLTGLSEGKHELVISHVAYETARIQVEVSGRSIVLPETRLTPRIRELGEVSVMGIRPDRAGDKQVETSLIEMSPMAIQTIPTARNDAFAAIKFMPGIEGTEPYSPLFTARGSDPGENAILLDGVSIYNPYHSSISSSIFNMSTIKNIDLLVGGFGAEYGGRNAMVMYLTTKDGNSEAFHGEVEPSTFSSRAFFEFPAGKDASMMVAGRYFYDIPTNFLFYSTNYFYDLNVSYTNRINDRNRVTVKLFGSKDHTGMDMNSFYQYIGATFNTDIYKDFDMRMRNNWSNLAGTIILKSILAPRLYLRSQLYYSTHSSANLSALDFFFETTDENGNPYGMKWKSNSLFNSLIGDACFKSAMDYRMSRFSLWSAGLEVNRYQFRNNVRLNDVDNGTVSRTPLLYAGYLENRLSLGPLVLRPGIRVSRYESQAARWEPRLNGILKLPGDLRIKAAWGRYYQYIISMNTSEVEMNQSVDYYYPLTGRPPSHSVHYILGAEKDLAEGTSVSLDMYYKDIRKIYTFDLNQTEVSAFTFSDKLQAGKGEAYGAELLVKGQYRNLSGWASYGLAWSFRQYPAINGGKKYPYDYGRRHSFKTVANYQFTNRLSYSASFTWLSGIYRSIENIMECYYYYDPVSNEIFYFPLWVSDSKNNARMPSVLNLDMGIRRRLMKGFGYSLARLLHASDSYATVTIRNILFLRRNVDWFIPGLGFGRYYDKYIPLGINYFPSVGFSYAIRF
jgi:hypothetical protein